MPRMWARNRADASLSVARTIRWLISMPTEVLPSGPESRLCVGLGMRADVTLHMDAPPEKVWGLISDITKMGEYSPEVIEAEWLDGATGPAVGARYRGHVRRNEKWLITYWTTCEVT